MALMVLTLNVSGVHDPQKWSDIWSALPRSDIICLQETHLTQEQEYAFQLHAQSYSYWYSHGLFNSAGVCVCMCRSVGVNIDKVGEYKGHMLALWLIHDSDSLDMTVVCIYAPPVASAHKEFFSALHSVVRGNIILIGDFNSVVESINHLSNNQDATSTDLGLLLEMLDFYEPPGSHCSTFTYHHPSICLRKSQIDRAYINFSSK